MELTKRFQDPTVLLEALMAQAFVQGDREVAAALSEIGELVQFASSEVLTREGEADREIFYLLMGKVSVKVKGKQVATRAKNETVGEMSAVNPSIVRSATVTALEPTVALKVSPAGLDRIAEKHPRVYRLIAGELASRLLQRNALIRSPNDRPRIFFICSKEALDVAEGLRHGLCHEPSDGVIWSDDNIFPPGGYPLEALEAEVTRADFGVAIAQPDDLVRSRDRSSVAPRDNVIFELGYFMSKLGRYRTLLLVPEMPSAESIKLPSDFKGLTPITYKPLVPGQRPTVTLQPTIYDLKMLVRDLGPRE